MTTRCCAICTAEERDAEDLVAGPDGALECRRCRTEHPRSGRYGFDGKAPSDFPGRDMSAGAGSRSRGGLK